MAMIHLAAALLLTLTGQSGADMDARWTTGWPSNSVVTRIVIDSRSPANIYAFANGRLWRSTDGARNWSAVLLDPCSPNSVAIDPLRPSRIEITASCGVVLSTDSGVTWKATLGQTTPELSPSLTRPVLIDPSHSDAVYIDAATPGFFRSVDGGLNWSRADFPFADGRLLAVASDGALYALSGSLNLFRSSDRGLTWAAAKPPGLPFSSLREIVVDPVNPAVVYALTGSGLFRSEDRGDSWELRGGGSALSLAIDPGNPEILYAGSRGGVWKSEDSGRSWKPSAVGPPFLSSSRVIALAIDPKVPTTVLAGAQDPGVSIGRGLVRTEDSGATWVRLVAEGLPSRLRAMAAAPGAPSVVYAVAGEQLSRSENAGANWIETGTVPVENETFSPTLTYLAIDPTSPTTLYIAQSKYQLYIGGTGQLLKSTDGGATSRVSLSGAVDSVKIDPTDPNRIYAIVGCAQGSPSCRSMKSVDGGVSWSEVRALPGTARQFLFDPLSPGVLYIVTYDSFTDPVFRAFRSADGGLTWASADAGLPRSAFSLAIGSSAPQALYAKTGSSFFKSGDGGLSWSPTGSSLTARALVVDPSDSSILYAGTEADGVFRSLDAGTTWQAFNSGLPDLEIYAIVTDAAGLYLHVTTGSGIYDLQLRRLRRVVESPRPARAVPPRR